MKESSQISRILQHAMGVQIIAKANVKIQKVTDFRSLIKGGVDFVKLKKAALVGEVIIVDNKTL
jgi:hypothetical protein